MKRKYREVPWFILNWVRTFEQNSLVAQVMVKVTCNLESNSLPFCYIVREPVSFYTKLLFFSKCDTVLWFIKNFGLSCSGSSCILPHMNIILIQEENSAMTHLSKHTFATTHGPHSSTQKYLMASSTSILLTIYLFSIMTSSCTKQLLLASIWIINGSL